MTKKTLNNQVISTLLFMMTFMLTNAKAQASNSRASDEDEVYIHAIAIMVLGIYLFHAVDVLPATPGEYLSRLFDYLTGQKTKPEELPQEEINLLEQKLSDIEFDDSTPHDLRDPISLSIMSKPTLVVVKGDEKEQVGQSIDLSSVNLVSLQKKCPVSRKKITHFVRNINLEKETQRWVEEKVKEKTDVTRAASLQECKELLFLQHKFLKQRTQIKKLESTTEDKRYKSPLWP